MVRGIPEPVRSTPEPFQGSFQTRFQKILGLLRRAFTKSPGIIVPANIIVPHATYGYIWIRMACHGMPGMPGRCLGMTSHAQACPGMPGHARACKGMPGHARVCPGMPGHAMVGTQIGTTIPGTTINRESIWEDLLGRCINACTVGK